MNDFRKCPECNALILLNGETSGICPSCGARITADETSAAARSATRYCMNCRAELRSGAKVCKQCGTDQESGKRVLSSTDRRQRNPGKALDGETSEGLPFILKAVLAAALVVSAVGVWWFAPVRSPSRPTDRSTPTGPRPAAQAPTRPTPTTDVAAPVPVSTGMVAHATPPLETALRRYEEQIRQARFEEAEETRRHMERVFTTKGTSASFWRQAFAPAEPASLTLAYVCSVCRDGSCPVCQGKPTCASCRGSGSCTACKGRPARSVPCVSCTCTDCLGSGRCKECRGEKTILCPECNGIGSLDSLRANPCKACNGTGTRSGLRTANGTIPLRCTTCRGTGKVSQRIRLNCPKCSATTRVPCPACSATGQCPTCNGTGRLPHCEICGGTGQTTVFCRTCKGNGKCPTCGGAGVCKRCAGTGRCYLCDGKNLIREAELQASSAWMKQKSGFVLFDTATRQIIQSSTNTGRHAIKIGERTMSLDVPEGSVLWVSTTADFEQAPSLLKPSP